MPGHQQDDHGHAVPDEASARALVQADIHSHGDGSKDHGRANVADTDVSAHVANDAKVDHPTPRGRLVDDSWVGVDEGAEL